MKPTYGAVSRHGLIAFGSSLDQIGPFALTVRDAALALRVIAGRDHCDSTSVELPEPIAVPEGDDLSGVTIGVPTDLLAQGVEPGVREAFDRSLEHAQHLGAGVREITLPTAVHALPAYYLIAPAEASANLARFDGVRYGLRLEEPGDTITEMYGRRLLRRLLRHRPAGAHADPARVRPGVRRGRPDRHAGVTDGGVPDRRADRRSLGHVCV